MRHRRCLEVDESECEQIYQSVTDRLTGWVGVEEIRASRDAAFSFEDQHAILAGRDLLIGTSLGITVGELVDAGFANSSCRTGQTVETKWRRDGILALTSGRSRLKTAKGRYSRCSSLKTAVVGGRSDAERGEGEGSQSEFRPDHGWDHSACC